MNPDEIQFYASIVRLWRLVDNYTPYNVDTARVKTINEFVDTIQITLQELCEDLSDDEFKILRVHGVDVADWLPPE